MTGFLIRRMFGEPGVAWLQKRASWPALLALLACEVALTYAFAWTLRAMRDGVA